MMKKNSEGLRNILLRTVAAAAAAALLVTTGCSLSHGSEDTTDSSAVSTAAPETTHDFSTGPEKEAMDEVIRYTAAEYADEGITEADLTALNGKRGDGGWQVYVCTGEKDNRKPLCEFFIEDSGNIYICNSSTGRRYSIYDEYVGNVLSFTRPLEATPNEESIRWGDDGNFFLDKYTYDEHFGILVGRLEPQESEAERLKAIAKWTSISPERYVQVITAPIPTYTDRCASRLADESDSYTVTVYDYYYTVNGKEYKSREAIIPTEDAVLWFHCSVDSAYYNDYAELYTKLIDELCVKKQYGDIEFGSCALR